MPLTVSHSWNELRNKPTTVAGFGITDMASQNVANATNVTNVSVNQVANATAGIAAGGVGSYAFMFDNTTVLNQPVGTTRAGSQVKFADSGSGTDGTVGAGTWKLMGVSGRNTYSSVWLRIA